MSEDIEKSLEERIEDARLEQILDIQIGAPSSSSEVCDCHRGEHEGITDENIKEHVEECLGEMLNNYIEDERNYIVDGAIIKCDRMSDEMVCIQFREDGSQISIKGGGVTPSDYIKPADIGPSGYNPEWEEHIILSHAGDEYIRKLYAVHGSEQSANNIPFATVIDRTCLRKEEAKGVNAEQGIGASIVSCGNCKILREEDIKKIAENWEGVSKYGTCYLFIKPNYEWKNPYCTESVVGKCNTPAAVPVCTVSEHHRPMKFDTEEGEKEGLTMLSTLLCIRGGVITIEAPGQIYIEPQTVNEEISDIEERIKQLMESVEKDEVDDTESLINLSTVGILARLIYQEQGTIDYQDAVVFSIVNRLFSNTSFIRLTNTNNLYSVITGLNQYESIKVNDKDYPNAYHPPDEYDSEADQKSWENAKKLAAILYIAIEEYGEPNENTGEKERDENVVRKGDEETYQKVIDFLEQQNLHNEIERRDSFYGTDKKDNYNIGGNLFYYMESNKK